SAGRTIEPNRFRRALRHDECRYEALRQKAAQHGLEVAPSPGLADPQHLTNRLGSLITDPKNHPYLGDSRFRLAMRGAWASCYASMVYARRAFLVAWFLVIGLLPNSGASRLLRWRLDPSSRPHGVKHAVAAIRRWILCRNSGPN